LYFYDMKYEEGVKRLEEILKALEKPETPLEELVNLFEEGTKIVQELQNTLENARLKVEKLVKDSEGNFSTQSVEDGKD